MPQILISPPPVEPVTLADMKSQCGYSPMQDADHVQADLLAKRLRRLGLVARQQCENITRRVFVTQTWKLLLDGWPHVDKLYRNHGHHAVKLPKQPFQSLGEFTYVDTQGITQPMSGWGFQTDPGSDSQPARLNPPYLMPWPPTRLIPNNISITFKCGYGGPVTVSMAASSAVLGGASRWNPGDVGQAISVPGAGAAGVALVSSVASVDGGGIATLADAAATSVADVSAYAGQPVPEVLRQAILFLVEFYDQNGAVTDLPVPRVVMNLLAPYCNWVS